MDNRLTDRATALDAPGTGASGSATGRDLASMRIAATTLGDLLLTAADRSPDHPAITFPGHSSTYAALRDTALRRARSLIGLGIRPGDHVGLLLPTDHDFVEMFFAVSLCGAVAVLMNARYRSSELAYVSQNADLKALVTTNAIADQVNFVQRLGEALPGLHEAPDPRCLVLEQAPLLRSIVVLGAKAEPGCIGETEFEALGQGVDTNALHRQRLQIRLRDTAIIMYTSGTSSSPKGCLISQEALVRNSINLGRNRWQFTATERVWSPLPLFHIAALLPLLSTIDAGGTYIGVPHFKPADCVAQIQRERVTMIFAPFVTFLQQMGLEPGFQTADFSSVRLMNSCFAVQPPSVAAMYRKAMPHVVQVGTYGMTEVSGIASTGASADGVSEQGFTRLGIPMDGMEMRIVDRETGESLPAGSHGEILVRGYLLFHGYYKDPERTEEALDADGWLHTGDIGSIDPDGTVMFHGRLKDMLKVGGENVAAAEVEHMLSQHPGVKLAQVCGIPDDTYVEVPVAFVERNANTSASEAELIAFCKDRISAFKVPRLVRFVDEWPMSASKIQKFKLRAGLLTELGLE